MNPNNSSSLQIIEQEFNSKDPLDITEIKSEDSDRLEIVASDFARVNTILETDSTLTKKEKHELYELGTSLYLDWLYADEGGRALPLPAFITKVKEAESFIKKGSEETLARHDRHPQDFWDMQTKMLDLKAYTAHRYAQDSQTTLKGTPQSEKLFEFSQDIMKSVLTDSIKLMKDMEKVSMGNRERDQDARGALYEVMLLAYLRLGTYQNQTFDEVFVRSALSREDHPWNNYVYPKRAFDIVIQKPDGFDLIQAKNHKNNEEYQSPIHKVVDPHFGETLRKLPRYINEMVLLIDNPKDPGMQLPMNNAQQQLDDVFGSQLHQNN